jgi:phosphosulfolactate synthase
MDEVQANDRNSGITIVLDRLSGLVKEEFEQNATYVTAVQFGWGLPLVWEDRGISSRIDYYHGLGVKVIMSGTLIEHSILEGALETVLSKAKKLNFDMIEVSDGIIDMTPIEKEALVQKVRGSGFEVLYTVGKKDPTAQPAITELLSQIGEGLKLNPFKVMIESRERGRGVGIYDAEGNIRWPFLRAITSSFDHHDLIFEAPLELQQAALILELGPEVNLAHVSFGSVASLRSERLGLRYDTFGIERPKEDLRVGPSTKFVLFAVRNYQPIDQKGIAAITQLPRRTIQKALVDLLERKLITEHPSFEDRRSKIYRTTSASPIERFH